MFLFLLIVFFWGGFLNCGCLDVYIFRRIFRFSIIFLDLGLLRLNPRLLGKTQTTNNTRKQIKNKKTSTKGQHINKHNNKYNKKHKHNKNENQHKQTATKINSKTAQTHNNKTTKKNRQ